MMMAMNKRESLVCVMEKKKALLATMLLLYLSFLQQLSTTTGTPEGDILIKLKSNLVDPNGVLQSWDPNLVSPCTWIHVSCDPLQNVISVDLGYSGLSGELVPELGGLTNLVQLGLFGNNISGSIPPELGQLKKLQFLDLYTNRLSGPIPPTLGQLPSLRMLRLSGNKLSGSIPAELGNLPNLVILDLYMNNLDGPIPNELGNLKTLTRMSLNLNRLTGPVPASFANLNSINLLDLTNNDLSGTIKLDHGAFLNITCGSFLYNPGDALMAVKNILNDPNNVLESWNNATSPSGPCANQPWDYIQCGSFKVGIGGPMYDSVTDIIITSANLSGQLPQLLHHLAKLPNLKTLNLRRNNIGGVIPPEVGNFTSLLRLSLDYNQLTGPIPNSILDQALSLKNNGLSGKIPDSLDKLATLYTLDLSYNQLDGSIPDSIGNCTQLNVLDLSHNKLTGSIPTISDPNDSLFTVDLSFNCLDLKGNTLKNTIRRTVSLGNNDPNGCPQS